MEGDSPPTWPQQTTALLRSRRRSSPPLLNPVMLILLIPILILIIIFLIILLFISLTSNFIKPISVTKGWDYLTILLVLVAILCGVFGKRNDDASATSGSTSHVKSEPLESSQWYEYPDQRAESGLPATGGSRLKRNSSSYPDFRQATDWETGHNQFRFFDDCEMNKYRSLSPPRPPSPEYNRHRVRTAEDISSAKVIPVDTFEVIQSPHLAVAAPPLPPATVEKLLPHQSFHSLPKNSDFIDDEIQLADTARSPPPLAVEKKLTRSDRKKSGSAMEIATAIADSIYRERKRKRRQRIQHNYEKMAISPPRERSLPPPTPPPQPPPPPPPSFYNIFTNKKGSKNKKIHSLSAQRSPPSPPPLPPSPRFAFNNMFKSGSKSKRFQHQSTSAPQSSIFNHMFKLSTKSKRTPSATALPPPPLRQRASIFAGRPPLPAKTRNINNTVDDIPAPRGDFVKIRSTHSSRCSFPELEDVDLASEKVTFDKMDGQDGLGSNIDLLSEKETSDKMDGGDGLGRSVTCPSPDVNMKADNFIARLKGEWRLEKMNSMRETNMGPNPSPRTRTSPKSY